MYIKYANSVLVVVYVNSDVLTLVRVRMLFFVCLMYLYVDDTYPTEITLHLSLCVMCVYISGTYPSESKTAALFMCNVCEHVICLPQ